eukprot:1159473-Pelagomonas_calceolata.AAC.1
MGDGLQVTLLEQNEQNFTSKFISQLPDPEAVCTTCALKVGRSAEGASLCIQTLKKGDSDLTQGPRSYCSRTPTERYVHVGAKAH